MPYRKEVLLVRHGRGEIGAIPRPRDPIAGLSHVRRAVHAATVSIHRPLAAPGRSGALRRPTPSSVPCRLPAPSIDRRRPAARSAVDPPGTPGVDRSRIGPASIDPPGRSLDRRSAAVTLGSIERSCGHVHSIDPDSPPLASRSKAVRRRSAETSGVFGTPVGARRPRPADRTAAPPAPCRRERTWAAPIPRDHDRRAHRRPLNQERPSQPSRGPEQRPGPGRHERRPTGQHGQPDRRHRPEHSVKLLASGVGY